jgi:tRNA(His) 5'-end guanylyltransferase
MMRDDLGDRMKSYEAMEAQRRLDTDIPVIARIDGRKFSKFTRGFDKPFDHRLTAAMDMTTAMLVEKTHASIGYTQSDEITLVWCVDRSDNPAAQMLFDGRVQKLCSVLAGMASTYFMLHLTELLRGDDVKIVQGRAPHFDCRVWNVPTKAEAANAVLWRYHDARKNAVSAFTRCRLSHKAMQGLSADEQIQAVLDAGGPEFMKATKGYERNGRFVQTRKVRRVLTPDELLQIPEQHRPPEDQMVERTGWKAYDFEFHKVTNRVEVIFDKADPEGVPLD